MNTILGNGSFSRIAGACIVVLSVGCSEDPSVQLLEQLKDPSVEVRRTALQQLDSLPGKHVTDAIAALVGDSDSFIRCLALHLLEQREDLTETHVQKIEASLEHSDPATITAAALSLYSVDPSHSAAIPLLKQALVDNRSAVFLKVGELGPDAAWAIPTLIKLLSDKRRQVRAISALTLGRIGPAAKDAVEALDRLIDDPEEAVSNMAATAIEQIEAQPGSKRELEHMIPL